MTTPTPLSPAAQAVIAAIGIKSWRESAAQILVRGIAAAALRAAADQVVPPALEEEFVDRNQALPLTKMVQIRHQLLAIAAELEGINS